MIEQGADIRLLHDPPGIHHIDKITDLGHRPQVMADQQDAGTALTELFHQVQDLGFHRDI